MTTKEQAATALAGAVTMAIARGCVHRNKAGEVLSTPRAVLECLLAEGSVDVQEPPPTDREKRIAAVRAVMVERMKVAFQQVRDDSARAGGFTDDRIAREFITAMHRVTNGMIVEADMQDPDYFNQVSAVIDSALSILAELDLQARCKEAGLL